MTDRNYDLNTWLETYKETVASFGKAQQDGFKALERFARFNYAVAGDYLEAGIAQTKAALSARAAVGTQAVADLLAKQAELSHQLSDKLRSRAQEFSTLASEVQESVSNFATDAASRAAGTKKAA
ncbi:MAG TPA: phasin family protein [Steroidobacteraceae bacterium]|jgi:Phasin protein|nr:phasin family protein [Steroidobacteraceae bacterium]